MWKSIAFATCLAWYSLSGVAVNLPAQDSVPEFRKNTENTFTVTGRVVNNATGQGFAGVRVSAVNTRITAMSDEKGEFRIDLPDGRVTLSVEAPGFHDQIVAVKGRHNIEIRILEDNGKAFYDETVFLPNGANSVTRFSTGITAINEDITARLNGQLRVLSQSGIPGSGSTIFSRGLNSLNASAQPLFIVDGIIWQMQENAYSAVDGFTNNPLALIEPNDIEKITVLKDATAIYGSKGANGVVIIDTKRSRDMATEIEAFINMGYRTPFNTIPVMDAKAFRLYASDMIRGMDVDADRLQFLDDDPTRTYYKSSHNRTDWFDQIKKGAFSQNYGVNVRGGDNIALYSFSMGYTKNDGNLDNTGFNRLNVRFNSDINLAKNFKVALDIAFAQTVNHQVTSGLDEVSSPLYLSLIKSPLYHPYQYDTDGNLTARLSDTDELNIGNPLAILNNTANIKKYRFNANARPTYRLMDKLELSLLFGYSWDKEKERAFIPDKGVSDVPLYNDLGEVYATALNQVRNLQGKEVSATIDFRATYDILKDAVNKLQVFAGYRFYNDIYDYTFGKGYNTGSDYLSGLENASSSLRYMSGQNLHQRTISWYLNGDYALYNRYIFNVSAAMESSSRFGRKADALKIGGVPWGLFPSVSAAWIISSESFMKNVDFINFLKLRLNYTLSGNDNIIDYARNSYFQSTHFFGNAYGLTLANIGNEKLKWESTSMAKVGLDICMFDNRWSVNADFYTSRTQDLLTRKQLDDVAGVKYFWSNDGELENKGFEITTNLRIIDRKDWKLDFGAMIGKYKNKVTSLANGSYTTSIAGGEILTAVGQPAGVFYGYKTKGVFKDVAQAKEAGLSVKSNTGELIPFEAGDMHFEDVNGDHIIDSKDRQIIGDPNPDFYGNFNFNFSYKGLTIGALFTYSYGNDAYNALRANLESGSSLINQSTAMQNRWVVNGQETDIPKATYGDPMGNARFSDRWIEDASYLRFKSLSVSYKIPVRTTFIQGLSVWASVNNVCTLTKYLGSDPEFSYSSSVLYQGIDAGMIPLSRSFNLGVKINL